MADDEEVWIEPTPLPALTEYEWDRILRGRRYRICASEEQRKWGGTRMRDCMTCKHTPMVHGDPRRGYCVEMRVLRSNANPVLCPKYEPKPKGEK